MMGGQIGVTSREGAGATFRVTLWLGLGDAADLPEVAQVGRRNALPDSYRDARVLVVDDNTVNQQVVSVMLEQCGCTVDVAGNGIEAVKQVQLLRGQAIRALDAHFFFSAEQASEERWFSCHAMHLAQCFHHGCAIARVRSLSAQVVHENVRGIRLRVRRGSDPIACDAAVSERHNDTHPIRTQLKGFPTVWMHAPHATQST
jgi:CheY-like chemotaxis protein